MFGRRTFEHILGGHRHRNRIRGGIERNGGKRHPVDVGCKHRCGAGFGSRDRRQAQSRTQDRARAYSQRCRIHRADSARAPDRLPTQRPNTAAAELIAPSSSSVFCQIGSDSSARWRRISGTSGGARSLVLARIKTSAERGIFGSRRPAAECRHPLCFASRPPMRQTSFHSGAVTGCTESREFTTSIILASFGFALTATSVTGFGMALSARTSTHCHVPGIVLGVGMGERRYFQDAARPRAHHPSDRRTRGRQAASRACCCVPDNCARRPKPHRPCRVISEFCQENTLNSDLKSQ